MSNQSIIEHKANMYYVEFREDYLALCGEITYKKPGKKRTAASPYCESFVLSIMEHWTNDKRGRGDDLFVFMSYQQWIDEMYGMYGRTVVIDSLEVLMGEGFLSREPYKMFGRDTFKYLLNYQLINERIRALPQRDPHATRPKINGSKSECDPSKNKRVSHPKINGSHSKMDVDPSKSNYNIESIIDSTQIPVIDSAQSYGAAFAATTPHTPLPEQNEDVTQATTPTGSGATVPDGGKEYHAINHRDRDDRPDSVSRATRSVPDRDTSQRHSPGAAGNTGRALADERMQRSTARKRTSAPIKPDLFESAPREVQAVITEWRAIFKTPAPTTAKLLEHATSLAAFQPDPGEIAACRLWMYQTDSKGWYRTHGMHLGDVARDFERFRSLAAQPAEDPEYHHGKKRIHLSSFDDPNYGQEQLNKEFYPVKPLVQNQEVSYAATTF